MNCYDENEWDGDTPKQAHDPYREIDGVKGGCGHPTEEVIADAEACAWCFGIALLMAAAAGIAGLIGAIL